MMPFLQRRIQILPVLLVGFSVVTIPSHAYALSWFTGKTWRPVLSLGVGTSTSSDVGQSKNFPIQHPETDEFYNYSAYQPTQTSFLFDGFLGVEWSWCPCWALQAGIAYNQTAPFSAKGTLLQGADLGSADSYTYHYNILSRQWLAEGKLFYVFKEHYRPYLLGGVGAAFNNAYNYSTSVPPNLTFTRQYANNSTTSFSYAVGLGIDMDINSNFRAGIGYRFADLGQSNLGSATIDKTSVSGTLSQSHLYTNEVLAQLTWLF